MPKPVPPKPFIENLDGFIIHALLRTDGTCENLKIFVLELMNCFQVTVMQEQHIKDALNTPTP